MLHAQHIISDDVELGCAKKLSQLVLFPFVLALMLSIAVDSGTDNLPDLAHATEPLKIGLNGSILSLSLRMDDIGLETLVLGAPKSELILGGTEGGL